MHMSQDLDLIIDQNIAELVLCRPHRRNALNTAMWRAIPDRINQAAAHQDVRCILVHGGGTGLFAAGADIAEFETAYSDQEKILASGQLIAKALMAIEHCPRPVIAAIEGPCYGAGVSLAVACDFRIADKTARFCIPPAKLGLTYPAGDTRRLIDLIGPGATRYLLMTATTLSAETARQISLIEDVCEGSAIEAGRRLARQMADLSPASLSAAKRMTTGLMRGWSDEHPEALRLFTEGFLGQDHAEGRAAFLEKRKPRF